MKTHKMENEHDDDVPSLKTPENLIYFRLTQISELFFIK